MSKLFELFGVKIKKGDYIFKDGDKADILYMIHRGRIEIYKKSGKNKKILNVLSDGEFVGEMAIIDSMPRSANAVALDDCELIKMDKLSFTNNIHENHEFSISVIQFLTKRLRETNEKLTNQADENKKNEMFIKIMEEFISFGKKDKAKKWVVMEMNPFLNKFCDKFSINSEELLSLFNEFTNKGKIKFKKDTNKVTWISYKIEETDDEKFLLD